MSDKSRKVIRVNPDDTENEIKETETRAAEDSGESPDRDFWLNTDFTIVSETAEAESRIFSPDSESVLKSAKQIQNEIGSAHRVGNVSSFGEDGYGPASAVDRLGDTKDDQQFRRAMAESRRKANEEAARKKNQSVRQKSAKEQTQKPARGRSAAKSADNVKKREFEGTRTAAGVKRIPSGQPRTGAPRRKTAAGVERIQAPARKSSKPAEKNGLTILGVKRISQSEEHKRAAREKKIKAYKKRRAATIRKVIISIVVWILVIGLCISAFTIGYKLFNDIPVDADDISKIPVTITGFENDEEMADMLESYGLIDDKLLYTIRCRLYDADYKEGTFKLSRSYTSEKIINILSGFKGYADGTMEEE